MRSLIPKTQVIHIHIMYSSDRLKRQRLSKTKMERRLQKGKTKERTQAKKDENEGKCI